MADMDLASSVALVNRHMYVQGLAHKLTFKIVGKVGHHRAFPWVSWWSTAYLTVHHRGVQGMVSAL